MNKNVEKMEWEEIKKCAVLEEMQLLDCVCKREVESCDSDERSSV